MNEVLISGKCAAGGENHGSPLLRNKFSRRPTRKVLYLRGLPPRRPRLLEMTVVVEQKFRQSLFDVGSKQVDKAKQIKK